MKKIIISILIMFLSLMSILNYSYAAGEQLEATIQITADATEVTAGSKVTLTFVTKDIKNAESGKIYAIGGKMEYDTNFFELDTTSGITLGDTGLFNSTNAVSEGGTNGTITLKVKDNATGSSDVEFSELTASDGRLEDMETLGAASTADQKITISIKQAEQNPPADDGNDDEQNPPADDGNDDEQNPPADDGNDDEQNPPADDGNDDEQNPPADDGNDDEQNPPADDGNDDEQNPPADDGNDDEQNPPADDEKDDEQNPPADDGKDDEKNPPADDENKDDKVPGTTVTVGDDKKDQTTTDKDIPKAGLNTMLVFGIVAIIIVAIVIYRKNKKYQDIV